MIKAVIFDIDGVLLDSFDDNFRFFNKLFKRAGYKPFTKTYYKKYGFHLPMRDVIKNYAAKDDEQELQRLLNIAYEIYQEGRAPKVTPGSSVVVRRLSKKYKLGLVTSRIKMGVDEYLYTAKVRGNFRATVYHGMYKHRKPHPESLRLALKKLKVKPAEAVYVGDSKTDIQAARAAKVKIIFYNKKRLNGADVWITKFKDLEKALADLQ